MSHQAPYKIVPRFNQADDDAPTKRRKVTHGTPYAHPSDGSTLTLGKAADIQLTPAQLRQWAEFSR